MHDACVTELFGQLSDYRRLVVIMQFRHSRTPNYF
ncbi:Uncharacterised protein [Vibrio cholerae]|nr:Uncharacterised protein [Vibrio cholerae]